MEYRIVKPNELYHYGVKGMKWGHRKDHNANGSLNEKGYSKYYTQGHLNRKGRREKLRAYNVKTFSDRSKFGKAAIIGLTAASAVYTYRGAKALNESLYILGNVAITAMRKTGKSEAARKLVAAATIGTMGAVTASSIRPYANFAYRNTRYAIDPSYKNSTDTLADLSYYEKQQRRKKNK